MAGRLSRPGNRKPGLHKPRRRGQAMAETALLTVLLIGWGGTMMYFFPDSLNALQIYMDSFYCVFSLPLP